jgi:methionine-rich copper-binding protein CopC
VYTTHPDDVESLYAPINGVVAGEIYVFRIERNGTSSDGHPVGGVYWFRLVE